MIFVWEEALQDKDFHIVLGNASLQQRSIFEDRVVLTVTAISRLRSLPSQADTHRQHLARHRRTFEPSRRGSASEQRFSRAGLLSGDSPDRYRETGEELFLAVL
jgi:hypothetical protein